MRRPILRILFVGCMIAIALTMTGCEEGVADPEPQGEIWVEITANEEASFYEIYWKNGDDSDAEEYFYIGTDGIPPEEGDEETEDDPAPHVDYAWLETNGYFVIQFVPFGQWQVRVVEVTIGTEVLIDEKSGETYFEETEVEEGPLAIEIESTEPKTVSFDFTD